MGSLFMFSHVFLSCATLFFFARRASLSLLSERRQKKRGENSCGGARDGTEQQGSERKRQSESDFFQFLFIFLKSSQAMLSQRKERDKRREDECGGVKSVYPPDESDSRLPANNPFWLLRFSSVTP